MGTPSTANLPIFTRYPLLRNRIPHVSLGLFPTPVTRCNQLETQLDLGALYIKRDDLSGEVYGGNKVRKLEFLLGKALQDGVKEVLTFGFAGSNHALATAIYARKVGLRSISMFLPQPNSRSLRRNLLLGYHSGAELHEYPNRRALTAGTLFQSIRHWARTGRKPMIIPPGGSSPLGVVGIVNAAFELADQIEAEAMAEPDLIYVAVGSMGTAVGLRIGLEAAGLRSKVVPIRVIDRELANPDRMTALARDTVAYLRSCDLAFPTCEGALSEYTLREEFFGTQYALYTEEGMDAIRLLRETEDIGLDGTYSGKAFAALLHDAKKGMLGGKTVLFWDTFNSRDPWSALGELDYTHLPKRFHRYFEEPVQPLDGT